jgi:membrane fusion protein (multidrug efflux system)
MNDVSRPEPPNLTNVAAKSNLRPFIALGVVVLAGVLGLVGYGALTANRESTDDALIEADVVPLAARVAGAVQRVLVVENQRVRRGDPAFVLDDADFRARVAQAQAELAVAEAQARAAQAEELLVTASATGDLHSAKAQVSSSQVDVQSADSRIDVARAALERAKADARKAEIDLVRANELRADNAGSQQQLDSAQSQAESARAALTQAEASLSAALDGKRGALSHVAEARGKLTASAPIDAHIAKAGAQAELSRAQVDAARASLELAKLQLSYTQIAASEDGVVSKLAVHPGQLAGANQPLAELVPSSTYIVANFKETQVGRMQAGDTAEVVIDAYPKRKFEAVVQSIAGGTGARFSLLPPDNASGNFVKVVQRVPVRLVWKAVPDVLLAAGLSADVTVEVRKAK